MGLFDFLKKTPYVVSIPVAEEPGILLQPIDGEIIPHNCLPFPIGLNGGIVKACPVDI